MISSFYFCLRMWSSFWGSLYFVFLYQPDVPADNNSAERALCNSVIHPKVSGGFRSDLGIQAHAIVALVTDTARKLDQDIFAILQHHIGPPAPTTL